MMSLVASWWDSQDWGSVPDWFAAVGTVSAFIAGVFVWARELRLKRRALADLMVVSVVRGEGYQFTVSMHNLSETSFHDVMVGYNDDPGSATWLSSDDGSQIRDEIVGKARVRWTAIAEVMPPPKHVFAMFMDARGQRWQVLQDRSGWRYISHRAYHKLAFGTPYNQKPLDYA